MAGTERDEYTYIRDRLYIHSELPTAINASVLSLCHVNK